MSIRTSAVDVHKRRRRASFFQALADARADLTYLLGVTPPGKEYDWLSMAMVDLMACDAKVASTAKKKEEDAA